MTCGRYDACMHVTCDPCDYAYVTRNTRDVYTHVYTHVTRDTGDYTLDLADPCDRAVAAELWEAAVGDV